MTRAMRAEDQGWVHALNTVFETELSPLTPDGLAELAEQAFLAQVADPQAAFMLAFDQERKFARVLVF